MNKSEANESIILRVIFALGLYKDNCQGNRVNQNTIKRKSLTVQRLLQSGKCMRQRRRERKAAVGRGGGGSK